uniref:Uncharacterized protein n=1 Tax=Meloidogyne enterolobii TaxID=390850 RepID=A0A6V7U761_MELEN|nr:unnamed protein product [Meloidogyne enterolobii]
MQRPYMDYFAVNARPTLRSSTKTVFPAKIQLVITLFRIIQSS